jgi:transcriptional regulator with XRE-family HTH domain
MKPTPKAWREARGLTLEQLSELTGYSVIAIRKFEAGSRNAKRSDDHSEWVMQRYRMACSGAERQLRSGKEFSW